MMKQQLRTLTILCTAFALTAPFAAGEIIYVYQNLGGTGDNLIRFDSATPGTTTTLSLSGFLGADSFLFGIDFRPADGLLYGRSSDGGLDGTTVRIDTTTGLMTGIGVPTANGGGQFYGIDFNPVVDRIRFVSDVGTNRRFNPNDGSLAATDTALSGTGVTHAAYTNNFTGAATTTLFAINTTLDTLVRIGGVDGSPSPNGGVLATIGALGVDAPNFGGFDISGASGLAYAVFRVNNSSGLYTINLGTGAATLVGAIGDGSGFYDGISVQPAAVTAVPEPSTSSMLGLGVVAAVLVKRRRHA